MRLARAIGAAAVLGALAATTGACSSGGSANAADPPSIPSVPQLATMRGQALPLEPYMLQPDAFGKIQAARQSQVAACMQGRGFDYRPVEAASPGKSQSEMRYILDAEQAGVYGYHAPEQGQAPRDPERSPEEWAALMGRDGGDGARSGGCFAEVDDRFATRGGIVQDDELVVRINLESSSRTLEDSRLRDAFTQWSACMRSQGFAYATPLEASEDPKWGGDKATPDEIATALADIDCMTRNNVVGVWFAVESAYQKQEIEQNFEKLEQIRRAIDTSVRLAEELSA